MELIDSISQLSLLDAGGVALALIAWIAIGWLIEHPRTKRPSVTVLMADYRREWMRAFVTRDPRIFDSQIMISLRQGTSFFASTCIFAIGGLLAVIGNTERLLGVAADLTLAGHPAVIWQIKLLFVIVFLTNGFLKFVWANRLFGYCSVLMASVPNDPSDPRAYPRAAQAAELNIRAAWNFNRGLRSVYFALGTLAWLLGPIAFILATLATTSILWTREFKSLPREIILGNLPYDPALPDNPI